MSDEPRTIKSDDLGFYDWLTIHEEHTQERFMTTETLKLKKEDFKDILNTLLAHCLEKGEIKFIIDDHIVLLRPDIEVQDYPEVLKLLYPKAFH